MNNGPFQVEMDYSEKRPISKQLKSALNCNAHVMIIIGINEMKDDLVTIKSMKDKKH